MGFKIQVEIGGNEDSCLKHALVIHLELQRQKWFCLCRMDR